MNDLNISISATTITEIALFGFLGFVLAMLLTPIYTSVAYKYKWWKKPRTTAITGEAATEFQKLHAAKHKRNIPTMAGIVAVVTVAIVNIGFNLTQESSWYLPLAAMVGAGMVGLLDDYINIRGEGKGVAGLRSKLKFYLIAIVTLIGGLWFYVKNDINSFYFPGIGDVTIGWLIVPLFMLVVIATANAVNISDGLDGLAGGLLTSAFGVYVIIALHQGNYGLAAFCATIVGALLSYTWFNIYPARFFMGDVGSFSLGTALGVVAMVTDTLVLLPLIGIVFVSEAGSVIIQTISKKTRNGKKIFRISPVHHHFEAIGWPETKVTMRFWIIGQVAAILGLIFYVVGGFA